MKDELGWMDEMDQQIKLVKDALSFSPNNVPLMKHLIQLLLQAGQEDEEKLGCEYTIRKGGPGMILLNNPG